MATLGVDADVLLYHAGLDGGAARGFLLDHEQEEKAVTIERTNWYNTEGGWIERVKITLLLVLADQQTNPDGSVRSESLAAQYASYLELRGLITDLGLQLANVSFENLHISAFACRERHFGGQIGVTLVLHSGNWPETVKVVATGIIPDPPIEITPQPGSWWFEDAIFSGQILTVL